MLRAYDDDDDDDDRKEKHPLHTIGVAVVVAGLTALATKLAEWGVEELRERYSPKPEKKDPKDPEKPTDS